jgi:hypothetical protein
MRNQSNRYSDDGKARSAIENGSMGGAPGSSANWQRLTGEYGQVLDAVRGHTREIHEASERYLAGLRQDAQPYIFVNQKLSHKSRTDLRWLAKHAEEITEVDMNDWRLCPKYITGQQFHELYAAVSVANRYGKIMNVRLDCTWAMMGFKGESAVMKILGHLLKNFNEWCCSKGINCAWIYVNEVGQTFGLHTHMMMAVPNEMRTAFRKWVKSFLMKNSLVTPIPKDAVKIQTRPSDDIERQWKSFQYLCKGVSPYAIKKANNDENVYLSSLIKYGHENPGQMNCKRIGVSTHIGKTIRKKIGFKSQLDEGVTDIRDLYSDKEFRKWLEDEQAKKKHSQADVAATLDDILTRSSPSRGYESWD